MHPFVGEVKSGTDIDCEHCRMDLSIPLSRPLGSNNFLQPGNFHVKMVRTGLCPKGPQNIQLKFLLKTLEEFCTRALNKRLFSGKTHIANSRIIECLNLTMSYPRCEFNISFGTLRETCREERSVTFGSTHYTFQKKDGPI